MSSLYSLRILFGNPSVLFVCPGIKLSYSLFILLLGDEVFHELLVGVIHHPLYMPLDLFFGLVCHCSVSLQ